MNAAVDPTRLYQTLTNTGLRAKDPILYQLLYNLIGNIVNLKAQTTTIIAAGGGGSTPSVTNINNIITSLGDVIEETSFIAIGGSGGTTNNITNNNIIQYLLTMFSEEPSEDVRYIMIPALANSVYDSPLTNGDPLIPEIIFDSNGDVVMVTGIPL